MPIISYEKYILLEIVTSNFNNLFIVENCKLINLVI